MAIPGAAAVARREGAHLLYWRGSLDTDQLSELEPEGEVFDRDLDAVEHWVAEAEDGRFDVVADDAWVAGRPTYAFVGELATCEVLAGELPRPEFPEALREGAPRRWGDTAARNLEFAEAAAARGDLPVCGGLLAKAAVAVAHATLAERGEWALTEARIVRRAGLGRAEAIIAATGDRPFDLERAVARMRVALGVRA